MTRLRALARALLALYLFAFLGQFAFTQLYEPPSPPKGATVIALGAGYLQDGTIGPNSKRRALAGAALAVSIDARGLVFTGASSDDGVRPVAAMMAEAAGGAPYPPERIIVEDRALSTLQNALFTADHLGMAREAPVVVVSSRFHLARAWASFRWARYPVVVVHPSDHAARYRSWWGLRTLAFETAVGFYNIGRAGLASAAHAFGLPRDRYIRWLD